MRALNWFFHGFHAGLTLFTLLGWIFAPLRSLHLAVCALTLFSWFGLGLALGKPGFCAITELHFHVRRRLGIQNQRESYLLYLARKLSGREPNSRNVEICAQILFYSVTLIALGLRFSRRCMWLGGSS